MVPGSCCTYCFKKRKTNNFTRSNPGHKSLFVVSGGNSKLSREQNNLYTLPRNNPQQNATLVNSHSIHGTGIITYIYHKKPAIHHSSRYKYTRHHDIKRELLAPLLNMLPKDHRDLAEDSRHNLTGLLFSKSPFLLLLLLLLVLLLLMMLLRVVCDCCNCC